MLNAEILRDAEQRRLTWRCRRGMLELDIVLQRFVSEQFGSLTLAEMERLDALLELPDNVFWDLIQGVKRPIGDLKPMTVLLEKLSASRPTAEQETR